MAKAIKRRKPKIKFIGMIFFAIAIALILVVSLMLVTPDATRLKESFDKKGIDSTMLGKVNGTSIVEEALGGILGGLFASDVTVDAVLNGVDDDCQYIITYFLTDDNAKDYYKKAKAEMSEDDLRIKTIARRGKAVYYGHKSCYVTFQTQLA